MNIEDFREYCLAKKGVTESFPFDETTLVFKVMGKMFALTDTEDDFAINIKCDPEEAINLREKYPCVKPEYHMDKKHWNTVTIDNSIPDNIFKNWVDNSYDFIVSKMSKKNQEYLKNL